MSTFEERIAKAVTEKFNDGTVEELVSDAATKALKSKLADAVEKLAKLEDE